MEQLTNWLLVIVGFIGLFLTVVVPLIAYLNSVAHKTRAELSNHKPTLPKPMPPSTTLKSLATVWSGKCVTASTT